MGITNGYNDPSKLGIDRWLAILGAATQFKGQNLCVFNCGTAITMDIVTANGEHQGGLIFPGVQLLHRAVTNTVGCQSVR